VQIRSQNSVATICCAAGATANNTAVEKIVRLKQFIRITLGSKQFEIALQANLPIVPPRLGHLLDTVSLQYWHGSQNPVPHPNQPHAHP
jgi:hypothetical protein